jgi:hypothetical protein
MMRRTSSRVGGGMESIRPAVRVEPLAPSPTKSCSLTFIRLSVSSAGVGFWNSTKSASSAVKPRALFTESTSRIPRALHSAKMSDTPGMSCNLQYWAHRTRAVLGLKKPPGMLMSAPCESKRRRRLAYSRTEPENATAGLTVSRNTVRVHAESKISRVSQSDALSITFSNRSGGIVQPRSKSCLATRACQTDT